MKLFLTVNLVSALALSIASSVGNEANILARFKSPATLEFMVINNSSNDVRVVGPRISGLKNTPQNYWIEALDKNGKALNSKLPTSFGIHPENTKFKGDDRVSSELKSERKLPPNETREEKLQHFHESGVNSGAASRDGLYTPLVAGAKSFFIPVDLKQWFDLKVGEIYTIKVKLQPKEDSLVIESNPVKIVAR